jgi:hypothetical protein
MYLIEMCYTVIFCIMAYVSFFIYKQEQLELHQSLKNLRIVQRAYNNKKQLLEDFKSI